ncbi:hypothetical protein VTK56DRAFT_6504 [Thermocarpiscus australiensis]
MPGMIPTQPLSLPPSTYGNPQPGMAQPSMSPNAMWTANIANGPIIEDLCAPPPMGFPSGSPPLNALPPRMPMAPMHPSAMPRVQNVFGIHQPTLHPFAPGMPGHAASPMGVPTSRVMGAYPPYASQQPGMVYPQRPLDLMAGLPGPRLETGFPGPGTGVAGGGSGMGLQQMNSPPEGGSPEGQGQDQGMPALTPVEESLNEFFSNEIGNMVAQGG